MITKILKLKKITNFIKNNCFLFFVNDLNKNKIDYLIEKNYMKIFKFKKYKITNNFLLKFFKNSVKKVVLNLFLKNSILSLINYNKKKITLFKNFFLFFCKILSLNILFIKLNNKFYSLFIIDIINSFNYYQNKKLIYKFLNINLKKLNFFFRNNVTRTHKF